MTWVERAASADTTSLERDRWPRSPRTSLLMESREGPAGAGGRDRRGTYQTGLFGEEVVADELGRRGWRLLGHRVRTRVGELDLVLRRGDVVVFAEVKTGGPGRVGLQHAVGQRSRLRIRRAAVAWMAAHPREQRGVRHYRFDVFFVQRDDDGGIVRIERVTNAF